MPFLPVATGSAPSAPTLTQQLFGGLNNGQIPTGATGFLALALGLLAQTGTTSAPAANAGSAAPSPLRQNLPHPVMGAEDPADLALPTLPVDWAAQLTQLQDGAPLSPVLRDFFGTTPQTLSELQAKLDQLDEDDQQALLGELAALLATVAPLPQPVAATAPQTDALVVAGNQNTSVSPNTLPQDSWAENRQTLDQLSRLMTATTPEQHKTPALLPTNGDAARLTDAAEEAQQDKRDSARASQILALTSTPADGSDRPQTETSGLVPVLSPRPGAGESPNKRGIISTKQEQTAEAATPVASATVTAPVAPAHAAQPPKTAVDKAPALAPDAGSSAPQDATLQTAPDGTGSPVPTPPQDMATTDNTTRPLSFAEQMARINRHGVHPPVSDQIAVHLSHSLQEGQDRVTIRLHPAELGRIEIKLDMSPDGRVTASFSVDQPATLDLLQRDQKGLERALSDAGLKSDAGALNFNLRDNGQQQGQSQAQNNQQQGGSDGSASFHLDGADEETPSAGQINLTWFVSPDRLDVRV